MIATAMNPLIESVSPKRAKTSIQQNLVDTLGGPDALAVDIEMGLRYYLTNDPVSKLFYNRKTGTIDIKVSSSTSRPVTILPSTDLRMPNYYRQLADTRLESLVIRGFLRPPNQGTMLFEYRETEDTMYIYDLGDKTLELVIRRCAGSIGKRLHKKVKTIIGPGRVPNHVHNLAPELDLRYRGILSKFEPLTKQVRDTLAAGLFNVHDMTEDKQRIVYRFRVGDGPQEGETRLEATFLRMVRPVWKLLNEGLGTRSVGADRLIKLCQTGKCDCQKDVFKIATHILRDNPGILWGQVLSGIKIVLNQLDLETIRRYDNPTSTQTFSDLPQNLAADYVVDSIDGP